MEHDVLVQVFKHLQFWKLAKIRKFKFLMVTIFYLSSKSLFFLKLKHFWDFAYLLSAFVRADPFFGLGLFWSNVNLFHNLLLVKKNHVITLLFWITSQHGVRLQNSRQGSYFSFLITLINDYKILYQPYRAFKLLKLCPLHVCLI